MNLSKVRVQKRQSSGLIPFDCFVTLGCYIQLSATVIGGVRQSSILQTCGTTSWITITVMHTGTTTAVRLTVSLFAASKINTL